MRMINDGQVLTFENLMNETEMKRKSFQGINNEEKIKSIFGVAKGVVDGTNSGIKSGSVEKLSDMMPSI